MSQQVIKPFDYERRIYNGSNLDKRERAIAIHIAWLARHKADASGRFTAALVDIGKATGYERHTVADSIDLLESEGWLSVTPQVAEGRYKSAIYRLRLPHRGSQTATETAAHRGSQTATETAHRGSRTATDTVVTPLPPGGSSTTNKYVSTYDVVGDAQPLAQSATATSVEDQKHAPPGPARPLAEPPDAFDAEHADMDAERLDEQIAELADPPVRPSAHDPLTVPCPLDGCNAPVGEACRGKGCHLERKASVYRADRTRGRLLLENEA